MEMHRTSVVHVFQDSLKVKFDSALTTSVDNSRTRKVKLEVGRESKPTGERLVKDTEDNLKVVS